MKIRFKHQQHQTEAVQAVANCFQGQIKSEGLSYQHDTGPQLSAFDDVAYKNHPLSLSSEQVLSNVRRQQIVARLPQSDKLISSPAAGLNLDIEMETGTGKTYGYIKTVFELQRLYGWSKFIIVVPSIAIREGVAQALQQTADHFQSEYGHRASFFTYNSKRLHNLDGFAADRGIQIMLINMQAFNVQGKGSKESRRIYEQLDEFQSRRPIDVIKTTQPILILDEPQKMEGQKTLTALQEFNPLFVLRYSATHKTQHNQIYRLDTLDAFDHKLVKQIAVRGISTQNLTGSSAYLYLQSIEVSKQAPVARIELEVKQKNSIQRTVRKVKKGDDLYKISKNIEAYKGFVVADIDARQGGRVEFTNNHHLDLGRVVGDASEQSLRRIQIREAIDAHLQKERHLFDKNIKVLSLFFIDEVAKYRQYTAQGPTQGEYAKLFEQEYIKAVKAVVDAESISHGYKKYLQSFKASQIHNGYFSRDKKGQFIDSEEKGRGDNKQCRDAEAYNLILKNKNRLLSFDEPTRFLFSHSALREGWDNPNVFVICALKPGASSVSRQQEVGRGMRLCVDQQGERQDVDNNMFDANVLTVVANESYADFAKGLQHDIQSSLSSRPVEVTADIFKGRQVNLEGGSKVITSKVAEDIYMYLVKNEYIDQNRQLNEKYYNHARDDKMTPLPEDLQQYKEPMQSLLNECYSRIRGPQIINEPCRNSMVLNSNFSKKEFQDLWQRINRKSFYEVDFDSNELIEKCVTTLNENLKIAPLKFFIEHGRFLPNKATSTSRLKKTKTEFEEIPTPASTPYNLIEKITKSVGLTRKTVVQILFKIKPEVFEQFKTNPEQFINQVGRLINEQKSSMLVESVSYDLTTGTYDTSIFTANQLMAPKASKHNWVYNLKKHIYDHVACDSGVEQDFAHSLDKSSEVAVYSKLPRGFLIPTPMGNYNPDWAIVFDENKVRHIYFVAETKGSMSSLQLTGSEETKIQCAKRLFDRFNKISKKKHKIKYKVIKDYKNLMDLIGPASTAG